MKIEIQRVVVYVSHPPTIAKFYMDLLGLKEKEIIDDTWILLTDGKFELGFHQAYDEKGKVTQPTGSEFHPHKVVFKTENVEALYEEWKKKNIKLGELKNFDGWKMFTAYDCENHPFQLTNL
jgi:catechol-2,3-dioxygenase